MTINPVDMQVLLPQIGQVNRVQRGLQNQQQTEQQILGQMLHQELKQKDNTVQKAEQFIYKKIKDEEKGKGRKENKKKKKTGGQENAENIDNQQSLIEKGKSLGGILDIKI